MSCAVNSYTKCKPGKTNTYHALKHVPVESYTWPRFRDGVRVRIIKLSLGSRLNLRLWLRLELWLWGCHSASRHSYEFTGSYQNYNHQNSGNTSVVNNIRHASNKKTEKQDVQLKARNYDTNGTSNYASCHQHLQIRFKINFQLEKMVTLKYQKLSWSNESCTKCKMNMFVTIRVCNF